MSDLISRSVLIKELKEWADSNAIKVYDTAYDVIQDCISTMENQPTAYDVEKVVAELEEAKEKIAKVDYCRTKHYVENDCEHKDCFKCCAEYLIEIVKQGGVSDDVCEWKKLKNYPFDWLVGCDGCKITHKQGDYCPRCSKKIKVVE